MALEKHIPIVSEEQARPSSCEAKEPYALMVLGDSMLPEFKEGDVITIDPEGLAHHESYVIAYHNDEYTFRQLHIVEDRWYLVALNDGYPRVEIEGVAAVKGVITQKKTPGRRGEHKFYR